MSDVAHSLAEWLTPLFNVLSIHEKMVLLEIKLHYYLRNHVSSFMYKIYFVTNGEEISPKWEVKKMQRSREERKHRS